MGTRRDKSALPSPAAVADRLSERIRELTEALVDSEPSQRSDTAWRFRSRGSLQVGITGEKRGRWKDHEEGAYGDALGLVAHLRRTSIFAGPASRRPTPGLWTGSESGERQQATDW
jgi:hypothetical protein